MPYKWLYAYAISSSAFFVARTGYRSIRRSIFKRYLLLAPYTELEEAVQMLRPVVPACLNNVEEADYIALYVYIGMMNGIPYPCLGRQVYNDIRSRIL